MGAFIDTASGSLDFTIGWGQRNLLYALSHSYQHSTNEAFSNKIEIIFLRGSALQRSRRSAKKHGYDLYDVEEKNIILASDNSVCIVFDLANTDCNFRESRVVGWESNYRGKAGPRQADLSALLDNTA